MEKNVTLSTRVPDSLAAQVDKLSAALRRSRSWILEEALMRYIQQEIAFVDAVQVGLDDLAAGRVVSHEEVMETLKRSRKKLT